MTTCFRCHVESEQVFRILNQYFCYKCYEHLLDRVTHILSEDRL